MLGLAALAALMAMAFVGASSAMAEPTQLCKEDVWLEIEIENEETKELEKVKIEDECKTPVSHVHETTLEGSKGTLLNSISDVLCDVLFLGDAAEHEVEGKKLILSLGNPLELEGNFTYTNCVDEKPNGCTVTEENGPSTILVLKEGHETATVTGEGLVKVVCSGITCRYVGTGLVGTAKGPLLSTEKNGEVSISKKETKKESGLLCPATSTLDLIVTPLEPTYIAS